MQLQTIKFLQQFRKEEVEFPIEERQYHNICFRHFSNSRKERRLLEKFLEKYITHSALIGALVSVLEKEDQAVNYRMQDLMKKLLKLFVRYGRREPYMEQYFVRLSAEITHFLHFGELFQDELQGLLLDKVTTIPAVQMGSGDIRKIGRVVREYLAVVYYYHDVFAGFLEEELGRNGTSAVISPVEAALSKLTTLIKSRIFTVEAVVLQLKEWRTGSRELEVQGIYN